MDYLQLVRTLDEMTRDLIDLEPEELQRALPNAEEVAAALICVEAGAEILRTALGYKTFEVAVRAEVRPGPVPPL